MNQQLQESVMRTIMGKLSVLWGLLLSPGDWRKKYFGCDLKDAQEFSKLSKWSVSEHREHWKR